MRMIVIVPAAIAAAFVIGAAIVAEWRQPQPDTPAMETRGAPAPTTSPPDQKGDRGEVAAADAVPADKQRTVAVADAVSGSAVNGGRDGGMPMMVSPLPGDLVAPAVRNVTPPGMTAGPKVDGPLVRVEGARPDPMPRARPMPQTERFFRVTVLDAGQLVSGERTIALAHIEAPAPDDSCGRGEAAWPCGRMARAALLRFIRGRAVVCKAPMNADELSDTAHCSVGGQDLSEWLVRNGWARASGRVYQSIAQAAEDDSRGLWSATRP